MIFQTLESIIGDSIWIISIAIAFGLALLITFLVEGKMSTFFSQFTLYVAFMAWGNILDYWIFILVFILFLLFVGFRLNDNSHRGA